MDEPELTIVEQPAILVVGRDHDEFLAVECNVPLKKRQRTPADRAEAMNRMSSKGKARSTSTPRITVPTWPVAPTTAIRIP